MRIFLLSLVLFSSNLLANGLDDYNTLLNKYISAGVKHQISLNQINYSEMKKDPSLATIRSYFEKTNPNKLNKKEKLAFYINAYNFYTIQLMLNHWKVDSIKDIGSLFKSVWKQKVGKINGQQVTLNYLEHEILRKMKEPRIHFAIVCASVSCPDIRNEAYRAEKLEQQLADQTKKFLNNQHKGAILSGNILKISKIFDWFEDDFDLVGGRDALIIKYNPAFKGRYKKIKYLDYDWSANGI